MAFSCHCYRHHLNEILEFKQMVVMILHIFQIAIYTFSAHVSTFCGISSRSIRTRNFTVQLAEKSCASSNKGLQFLYFLPVMPVFTTFHKFQDLSWKNWAILTLRKRDNVHKKVGPCVNQMDKVGNTEIIVIRNSFIHQS